jgi:integrase/recombinase XerD
VPKLERRVGEEKRRCPIPSNNVELIAHFTGYLSAERDATENTIESYATDVRKFAEWFEKPLASTKRTDVQKYLSELLQSGASGTTASRRRSCLRTFFRFLVDEGLTAIDPTRNLPVPKTWQRVPKSLSLADLEKMVASLGTSWIEIRDRAMLLIFFASGLRASELASLKLQDVDLAAGAAKVWEGKGRKDGIVPLSPLAIAALRQYLENVRPHFDRHSASFVFLGQWGRPLTRVAIWSRVSKIAAAALGKQVSPHFLRHGFATALVEGGADIRDVQVLMRHASVDTTAIYVHTDLQYLRRIYYETHPRARIAQAAD